MGACSGRDMGVSSVSLYAFLRSYMALSAISTAVSKGTREEYGVTPTDAERNLL